MLALSCPTVVGRHWALRAPPAPPVVGGLGPQGVGLEGILIDKNQQNQLLQPSVGDLGLIGCILSCPPCGWRA